MRAIGIDPGYDRCGIAVIERMSGRETLLYSCCIVTDRDAPHSQRLHQIGTRFMDILSEYAPSHAGIETLFFNQNRSTAIGVAEARGMLIFLATQHGVEIHEYSPQEVKIAVTGYGKSDKAAVTAMLPRLLGAVPGSAHDDEYDAIAVALTCLAHHR